MKYIFIIATILLSIAGIGTFWSYPDMSSDVPVIYWVSAPNPTRDQQIKLFHQWLIKQGLTTGEGEPIVDLRLDTANQNPVKIIIQGVSGVGGDVIDINSGRDMIYYHSIGLLADLTDSGKLMGFDPSHTYPSIESDITIDGRQYMFPCNVTVYLYWVNKATLSQYGLPLPPKRWSFDEFEELGKQFVAAANQPGQRQTKFYANRVDLKVMHRSLGLSIFNETMTGCALDDERFVQSMKRIYQWTYVDHILPSAAELSSLDAQTDTSGTTIPLFARGNYGMFMMGRYALIQLRKYGDLELAVVEPPNGGFPNALLQTRAAAIYTGSKQQKSAKYFLSYLASEEYNMEIVRDADALPPNPKYAQTDLFLRPPDYPNEWGCHEAFYTAAQTIGIGGVNSPFVLSSTVDHEITKAYELYMNDRLSAEESAKQIADQVNARITRGLADNPQLQPLYDQLVSQQKQIDRLRATGQPVPLKLVTNPFYRKYGQSKGWVTP